MEIEIWSDIACPWCYIGKRRFEKALAGFAHRDDVRIRWRSFQLDPSLPEHFDGTETEYLSAAKGMPADQIRQMFGYVAGQAAGEGLHFDFDTLVVANSRRAHQLLHLAAEHGLAGEAKEAMLAAHFEQGQDIGDRVTLATIGDAIGIPDGVSAATLETDRFLADVDADIDEAQRLEIRGVPFYVVDRRYAVSGAQPPEVFAEALDRAWSDAHPVQLVGDPNAAPFCGPEGCTPA